MLYSREELDAELAHELETMDWSLERDPEAQRLGLEERGLDTLWKPQSLEELMMQFQDPEECPSILFQCSTWDRFSQSLDQQDEMRNSFAAEINAVKNQVTQYVSTPVRPLTRKSLEDLLPVVECMPMPMSATLENYCTAHCHPSCPMICPIHCTSTTCTYVRTHEREQQRAREAREAQHRELLQQSTLYLTQVSTLLPVTAHQDSEVQDSQTQARDINPLEEISEQLKLTEESTLLPMAALQDSEAQDINPLEEISEQLKLTEESTDESSEDVQLYKFLEASRARQWQLHQAYVQTQESKETARFVAYTKCIAQEQEAIAHLEETTREEAREEALTHSNTLGMITEDLESQALEEEHRRQTKERTFMEKEEQDERLRLVQIQKQQSSFHKIQRGFLSWFDKKKTIKTQRRIQKEERMCIIREIQRMEWEDRQSREYQEKQKLKQEIEGQHMAREDMHSVQAMRFFSQQRAKLLAEREGLAREESRSREVHLAWIQDQEQRLVWERQQQLAEREGLTREESRSREVHLACIQDQEQRLVWERQQQREKMLAEREGLAREESQSREVHLAWIQAQAQRLVWERQQQMAEREGLAREESQSREVHLAWIQDQEQREKELAQWKAEDQERKHMYFEEQYQIQVQEKDQQYTAVSKVQHAYRGYSLRRRLVQAMEHAKYIDTDEFNYHEVDLDSFLRHPPRELEDQYWEKVNPRGSFVRQGGFHHDELEKGEEEDSDDEEAQEVNTIEDSRVERIEKCRNKREPEPPQSTKEQMWKRRHLASTRKQALRRQRAQIQADPMFRFQRFKSNTTQPSSRKPFQEDDSSSKKKKKKRQALSVVDRLRKKCGPQP